MTPLPPLATAKSGTFSSKQTSYVSLQNLLPCLSTFNHERSIYAGAQIMIYRTELAYGGSGFLLSSTVAAALRKTYHSNKPHWESSVGTGCCCDKVAAEALLALDSPVYLRAFPLFQGETLASIDWSRTHWCRPAPTCHHVDTVGIDRLWQFEARWRVGKGPHKPILFRDYDAELIHSHILAANATLPVKDNLSDN
jgi:hypothetical protein